MLHRAHTCATYRIFSCFTSVPITNWTSQTLTISSLLTAVCFAPLQCLLRRIEQRQPPLPPPKHHWITSLKAHRKMVWFLCMLFYRESIFSHPHTTIFSHPHTTKKIGDKCLSYESESLEKELVCVSLHFNFVGDYKDWRFKKGEKVLERHKHLPYKRVSATFRIAKLLPLKLLYRASWGGRSFYSTCSRSAERTISGSCEKKMSVSWQLLHYLHSFFRSSYRTCWLLPWLVRDTETSTGTDRQLPGQLRPDQSQQDNYGVRPRCEGPRLWILWTAERCGMLEWRKLREDVWTGRPFAGLLSRCRGIRSKLCVQIFWEKWGRVSFHFLLQFYISFKKLGHYKMTKSIEFCHVPETIQGSHRDIVPATKSLL